MKHYRRSLIMAFGAAVLVGVLGSQAYGGRVGVQKKNAFNTKPVGKIAPWDAMSAATKSAGGKALSAIYEFDEGKWIYGVIVVKNHKVLEVAVDPTTGAVLESEDTTPDAEAKEMKADLTKALADAGK